MRIKILAALLFLGSTAYAGNDFKNHNVVAEGNTLSTFQVTVATQTSPSILAATVVLAANQNTLCVKLANINPNFRIAIGTSTNVSMINGYILQVSSSPGNTVSFQGLSAPLFAFGEGSITVAPILSGAACSVP